MITANKFKVQTKFSDYGEEEKSLGQIASPSFDLINIKQSKVLKKYGKGRVKSQTMETG
jgi:hypothetical protein